MKKIYILAAMVLCSCTLHAQPIITTMAGNGTPAYGGDGGPATLAKINNPHGVAVDHIGNVYITDFDNNRIRKVDTFGVITTVAGTGVPGFAGDGGMATDATIQGPMGIAVDAAGNVYFTDGNNAVRKITVSTGIITRSAGVGGSFSISGDGGPATAATLGVPWGVAFDPAGNYYLADVFNHRVRKVTPAGIITTYAGTGGIGFAGDGGMATAATLNYPIGVAADGAGNVYVADNGNNRVRKINSAGIISTVTGVGTYGFTGDGGPASAARIYYPKGLATDAAGNLYICDYNNNRIRKVSTTGIINTVVGTGGAAFSGDGGPAIAAEINQITGVAIGANGTIYISDNDNHRIRKVKVPDGIVFENGPVQTREFCLEETIGIDTLLRANDQTVGLPINWNVISGPTHGGLSMTTYTGTSVGGTAVPAGFGYSPIGYTGLDSIKVVVTDAAGHTDTTTVYMNIVAGLYPGVINATADTVCPGDTLMLHDAVAGGVWSSSATGTATVSTGGVMTAVAAGSTTISYTVTNICGPFSATKDIYVLPPQKCINRVAAAEAGTVSAGPNPNNGTFTVYFGAGCRQGTLEVFDMMGRRVERMTIAGVAKATVQMRATAGVYLVRYSYNGTVWQGRINVDN